MEEGYKLRGWKAEHGWVGEAGYMFLSDLQ